MTEIPGTGKITPAKAREKEKEKKSHIEKLATLNIREMKKKKNKGKSDPEDKLWYNQLRYWVLFGTAIGIIFVPLSLITNWRFIFLAILGPLSGWISWYMRRFIRKFSKETDIFIKRF